MVLDRKLDQKNVVRAHFKERRKYFAQHTAQLYLEDFNKALGDRFSEWADADSLWIGYLKHGDEADPSFAIKSSRIEKWAYPKIIGNNLKFYIPKSDDDWESGPWGILEPSLKNSMEVDLHSSQGILVPGVAFDRKGGRLGSGRGFYDRVLHNYLGKKVGIGFQIQISNEPLPLDSHDVPMTDVVTEKEVFSVNERN